MSKNPIYLELTEEKCMELALENAEQIWWLGKHHERLRILQVLEDIMQEFKRKEELERYLAKVKKVLNEGV